AIVVSDAPEHGGDLAPIGVHVGCSHLGQLELAQHARLWPFLDRDRTRDVDRATREPDTQLEDSLEELAALVGALVAVCDGELDPLGQVALEHVALERSPCWRTYRSGQRPGRTQRLGLTADD